jgi:TolB-like protein/lipoprotein NlpI
MSFFAELKRRNVVKVGIAYLVSAWLLIQVADILLDNIGTPPWVLQTLFVVLGVGFFIALFFAWAFELTPEGVKREKEVDRSQSITPQTGKKLNNTILILMALAIGYLLFDKFSTQAPTPLSVADQDISGEPDPTIESEPVVSRQSIAVLPFDNRSNREEDQFFTDGIHDDLLTTIARIGSMKVISRTSVMEYKGTTKKIPEIAAELGVANILEGGIQRSGDQVRINVQLIDAQTDEHLWAQIFDRELTADNLFAIQSEISKAIATALQATLSPEEEKRINTMPTNNLQAYDAYMRGRQLMATRDSAKLQQAIEEFNHAVDLDSEFALAWVGVADSNFLFTGYGTQLSTEESLPVREHAIERALAIDEDLGEAYAALGSVYRDTNEYEKAEIAFQKAIQLSPNYASAYQWYGNHVANFPLRIDERTKLAQRATELDPRSAVLGVNLGDAYRDRGLYSMAERQYQKIIDLNPGSSVPYRALANLNTYNMSRYELALAQALKAYELDPGVVWNLTNLLQIYLELGYLEAAERTRERIVDLNASHPAVGFTDIQINLHKKNSAGTSETINWVLPKVSNITGAPSYLATVALALGDIDRAREIFLSTVPGWLDPDQWENLLGLYQTDGCVVSWILLNTGDTELGQQLLERSTFYLTESLPAVNEHADIYWAQVCYLTAGEKEKALRGMETVLDHNHLFAWEVFLQLPMFDLIRHEPRYQALLAERERRIAVQREAIEAAGLGTGI